MLRRIISLAILLFGGTAFGAEKVFDFRADALNEMPRGFRSTVAGSGQPGEWKIIQDEVPSMLPLAAKGAAGNKRPVLAQLSRDPVDEHFPMLVYEEETFGDFSLTIRFKAVDGAKEQMAGIVFRMQDERNFYYIRASALGSTFSFFKVVDGQRTATVGNKVEIPKGVWHQMTIECKGTRIRGLLNGKEVFDPLDDKSFSSGKIGFWTKSDSVSYFTDAVLAYKPKETLAQSLVKSALAKYPRLLGLKIYAPTADEGTLSIIASMDATEVGQSAPKEAREVLIKRGYYYGKGSGSVMLTLPLHDSNGEKVAAVRIVMKTFLGQTEKNALARAMPVVQGMETRIQTLKDLTQ
jgi:hypothetical protein